MYGGEEGGEVMYTTFKQTECNSYLKVEDQK